MIRNSIPGRGNSRCKGPEAGIPWEFQVCSRLFGAEQDRSQGCDKRQSREATGPWRTWAFMPPALGSTAGFELGSDI